MSRLKYVLVAVSGLLLTGLALGGTAQAATVPVGTLTVNPAEGGLDAVLAFDTSDSCPSPANASIAKIYGLGFTPQGQNLTGVAQGNTSNTTPFTIAASMSLRDLAALMPVPQAYAGEYKIVATCRLLANPTPIAEFVGHIKFVSSTVFVAIEPPGSVATVPPVLPSGAPVLPTKSGGVLITSPTPGGSMIPAPPSTSQPTGQPSAQPTPAASVPSASPVAPAAASGGGGGKGFYAAIGIGLLIIAGLVLAFGRIRKTTTNNQPRSSRTNNKSKRSTS